jgi:hypothetical protein
VTRSPILNKITAKRDALKIFRGALFCRNSLKHLGTQGGGTNAAAFLGRYFSWGKGEGFQTEANNYADISAPFRRRYSRATARFVSGDEELACRKNT